MLIELAAVEKCEKVLNLKEVGGLRKMLTRRTWESFYGFLQTGHAQGKECV